MHAYTAKASLLQRIKLPNTYFEIPVNDVKQDYIKKQINCVMLVTHATL